MMDYETFKKQDFFLYGDHFAKSAHIPSMHISGDLDNVPRLSIVIPTYGRAQMLEKALASCLAQENHTDFNIVVTDNDPDPSNQTARLIASLDNPRIVYYKNLENIGALANFNRCIEMARSEYVMMLHTDDILYKDCLSRLMPLVEAHPDIQVFAPRKDLVNKGRLTRAPGYFRVLDLLSRFRDMDMRTVMLKPVDFLLYYPFIGSSGVVYRREVFLASGGFNPDWHPSGDYILHLQMARAGGVALSNVNAGQYIFQDNISGESGMWTRFALQYLHLAREINRVCLGGRPWVDPFLKGSLYRKMYRRSNQKTGKGLDNRLLQKQTGWHPHVFHFLFSLLVWALAGSSFFLRAWKEARCHE